MPRQKVPDIEFKYFVVGEIKKLFDEKKLFINTEYQRGDIWKPKQRIELIKSIENRYSIGVIVLYVNEQNQYEILDGQQRLITIQKYLYDDLDLSKTEIQKYSDLNIRDKALLDAYCIYYLKLKSHDSESKEEDIVQTFLRLQEGTPLNKAEKINAYRGKFKDTFCEIRNTHPLFSNLGPEKRFRYRQLTAELLLLELESDFTNKIFPSLDLKSLIKAVDNYSKEISKKKLTFFVGNLDFLYSSLNIMLTAFIPRDVISFYLLVSYLRKNKANNKNLINEVSEFAKEFLINLSKVTIYQNSPPSDMTDDIFKRYKSYKQGLRIINTIESTKSRFEIILDEFNRLKPFIMKDPSRYLETEQKRIIYFRQAGKCHFCGKEMKFQTTSAHHGIAHSDGGKSSDLENSFLLHEKCHLKYEKQLEKQKQLKLSMR